jgi:hypothetical protein
MPRLRVEKRTWVAMYAMQPTAGNSTIGQIQLVRSCRAACTAQTIWTTIRSDHGP